MNFPFPRLVDKPERGALFHNEIAAESADRKRNEKDADQNGGESGRRNVEG